MKKEKSEKLRINQHPVLEIKKTFGQVAADKLTEIAGSWTFILSFLFFIVLWIIVDVIWITARPEDQSSFLLLNLILSCLAAIQAPIILMSQNRQGQKDRLMAEYDYSVDKKSEKEIREIREQLNRIEKKFAGK